MAMSGAGCSKETNDQELAKMQLFVRNIEGRISAVSVEREQTVGHLKRSCVSNASTASLDEIYMVYAGRVLPDDVAISDSPVKNLSLLSMEVRVRGGGGDGGATGAESRDCYLKMYADKKPDKVDPNEAKLAKFTRCTLSSEALSPPCVMDFLGNLYNKEAVVQALLTKSVPKKFKHVLKSLKDVLPIHLSAIPGVSADDDSVETKFHCPVTGLEFNGKFRFYALRGCGHVLSARVLKEVQTKSCLVCYKPFVEEDKFVINGTEEEVLVHRERWELEKAKLRDVKKERRNSSVVIPSEERPQVSVEVGSGVGVVRLKADSVEETSVTASLPPPVNKRKIAMGLPSSVANGETRKTSEIDQQSKKFKAAEVLLPQNATKEVYASIFTSSSKTSMKETYSCRSLPIGRN